MILHLIFTFTYNMFRSLMNHLLSNNTHITQEIAVLCVCVCVCVCVWTLHSHVYVRTFSTMARCTGFYTTTITGRHGSIYQHSAVMQLFIHLVLLADMDALMQTVCLLLSCEHLLLSTPKSNLYVFKVDIPLCDLTKTMIIVNFNTTTCFEGYNFHS